MSHSEPPVGPDPTRQRRLGDAGRLVPLLAMVLLTVPILWVAEKSTASALIYIFSAWVFLIFCNAALSRALRRYEHRPADPQTPER